MALLGPLYVKVTTNSALGVLLNRPWKEAYRELTKEEILEFARYHYPEAFEEVSDE